MSEIGKPFKRYDKYSNSGAGWLGWLYTGLFVIVLGFIVYLCWVEQSVTFGAKSGMSAYTLEGEKAITTGYWYFALLLSSFCFVLMDNPYRRFIYLTLFVVWLIVVLCVHFTLVVNR